MPYADTAGPKIGNNLMKVAATIAYSEEVQREMLKSSAVGDGGTTRCNFPGMTTLSFPVRQRMWSNRLFIFGGRIASWGKRQFVIFCAVDDASLLVVVKANKNPMGPAVQHISRKLTGKRQAKLIISKIVCTRRVGKNAEMYMGRIFCQSSKKMMTPLRG